MPTGIKVELIDKTGTLEIIETHKQINWKGKVFWRGSYTTAPNYYYSGAKFTLYFPSTSSGTTYVNELGLINQNIPLGLYTLPYLHKTNNFY